MDWFNGRTLAVLGVALSAQEGIPQHRDLSGLPVRFHPDVEIREWREERGALNRTVSFIITTAGRALQAP